MMSEKPLVSIIITTCKREMDILERAIKSAVAQTYENKEIIVVNDWPDYRERIEELLKGYPEIIFISNAGQSGACVSRNKGTEAAKGEYIALLDDDDEWLPEKIEKHVDAVDDDTVLVYCDIFAIKDGAELMSDPKRPYPEGNVIKEILVSNFVGGCSVPLMSKSAVTDCGGFDPAFRSCQDLDLWIRLAKEGEFTAIKEKLVRYTVGEESITGSFDRRLQGWEKILEKYEKDFEAFPEAQNIFTGTIVREAAKCESFKKYGNTTDFIKGRIMRMLGVY